jgi:hypothetical protein
MVFILNVKKKKKKNANNTLNKNRWIKEEIKVEHNLFYMNK